MHQYQVTIIQSRTVTLTMDSLLSADQLHDLLDQQLAAIPLDALTCLSACRRFVLISDDGAAAGYVLGADGSAILDEKRTLVSVRSPA